MEVLEKNSSENTPKQNLLEQIKIYLSGNFKGIKKNKRANMINYGRQKKYHR